MAVPARRLVEPARKHGPARPVRRATPAPARRGAPRQVRRTAAAPRRKPAGKSRPGGFGLFALMVVGTLVVSLASTQAMVSQNTFRLTELSDQAQRLENEYGRLRLRVAELSGPERVHEAARRAGLVAPGQVELLEVEGQRPRRDPPPPGGVGETVALQGRSGGGG